MAESSIRAAMRPQRCRRLATVHRDILTHRGQMRALLHVPGLAMVTSRRMAREHGLQHVRAAFQRRPPFAPGSGRSRVPASTAGATLALGECSLRPYIVIERPANLQLASSAVLG